MSFKFWLESEFNPQDLVSLGLNSDFANPHPWSKYIKIEITDKDCGSTGSESWDVHFLNDRSSPIDEIIFKKLAKSDIKYLKKFFCILRLLGVNNVLQLPILMRYMGKSGNVGFYRANTEDMPNPIKTSTNYVEIIRTSQTRAENLVRTMVHEYGHAIYHALDSRVIEIIRRYAWRELKKYNRTDVNQWWSLGKGKGGTPGSNIPTDYARPDLYKKSGFYPSHESGAEWFSEVLADLVIKPELQQPFLRMIRSQIAKIDKPEFRQNFHPDSMQRELGYYKALEKAGAKKIG